MNLDKHANSQKDRLDRWLDSALRQYGDTEPRAGLERRIIANLEIAQRERISAPWWRAFAISVLAACFVLSIWVGMNRAHRKSAPVARPLVLGAVNTAFPPRPASSPGHRRSLARRATRHASPPQPKFAVEPRLAQFPSPRPLTEQEQLLARYVRNFPQEARIVAREQTEVEAGKQLEELAMEKSLGVNSDQRER